MPRLTEIDDVLFPVKLCRVYASSGNGSVPIPSKRAIINTKKQQVVGVISEGYRLFDNEEALDAAFDCCHSVFPETKSTEWKVSAVDAPSTGGHCHIDLVHTTTALDFKFVGVGTREEVPESFGPFIRVTNSYNGSRALSFSIGFYRKVCANGMVGPDIIIKFRYSHTRQSLGNKIQFEIEHGRLAEMKKNFLSCFQILRDFKIDQIHFKPLIIGVLKLNEPVLEEGKKPNAKNDREIHDWHKLEKDIQSLTEKYVEEQGTNAYAVLNAITDLASHSNDNRCMRRDKNSKQRLAGEWLISFTKKCKANDFSMDTYLSELELESA